MSAVLVLPTYFSPIAQYVAIANSDKIIFEIEDNFQKQTYRNRCTIYAANGKQLLNVPVQHNKGVKQKTKDIKIDYKEDWQKLQLKALQSAYNSSPFFEFYIDDLLPVFKKKFTFLIDLNLSAHQIVMDALQLEVKTTKTQNYITDFENFDFRKLAEAKNNKVYSFNRYIQVFEQKHGFIANLSILDLIFMEGPNALNYLENQTLAL